MDQTEKLLSCVAKNAESGMLATEDLLSRTEDDKMRGELRWQKDMYRADHENAARMLNDLGHTPEQTGIMSKVGMWMGVQMDTMFDRSNTHIADIMIQGATMGITETTKAQNECPDASPEARGAAASFITRQQDSIERMKQFLR